MCLGLGEKKSQRHIHGFQEIEQNFCFFPKFRQIGGIKQVSSTWAKQLLKPRHMIAVEL